ncbi:MAG: hypothetical protein M1829_003729 [Trizodia sp. TS-e1964]|nr:MAG: hypothetical protein M1829_003729 [Trizodia sp. TS-e1964]
MGFRWMLAVRVAQAVFAITVLAMSTYVAHWYAVDTDTTSAGQINILIFNSLWTLLALSYITLTPRLQPSWHSPTALLAIEVLSVVFWFAGGISLAIFLTQLVLCVGSVCAAARTACVIAVFQWLLFIVSSLSSALSLREEKPKKIDLSA